jgi:hypothetical protein
MYRPVYTMCISKNCCISWPTHVMFLRFKHFCYTSQYKSHAVPLVLLQILEHLNKIILNYPSFLNEVKLSFARRKGNRGIASRILDLGTRPNLVVNFTLRLLYPHGRISRYQLTRRLGGPQRQSVYCRKEPFAYEGNRPTVSRSSIL